MKKIGKHLKMNLKSTTNRKSMNLNSRVRKTAGVVGSRFTREYQGETFMFHCVLTNVVAETAARITSRWVLRLPRFSIIFRWFSKCFASFGSERKRLVLAS